MTLNVLSHSGPMARHVYATENGKRDNRDSNRRLLSYKSTPGELRRTGGKICYLRLPAMERLA